MSEQAQPGLLRSAGIVSAAVLASRLTGLLRESVLGALFGAGAEYDAYVLGYRIPSLARELFAEGALSSAFIPTFTRYLSAKSKEEARELSRVTGTMTLLIVGLFCVLGMVFAPSLVGLFAPGFHATPEKFELAVKLVRIMFPFLVFLALAAQCQGILNSLGIFGVPALSSAVFNIATVATGVLLGYVFGPRFGLKPIEGMAAGIVFGGVAQLAFQLPGIYRAGFAWRPAWNLRANFRHPGFREILRLTAPALVGSASGQINVLVNTNLAAGMMDATGHVMNGPVSWLSYAYRFFSLPMGVFGVAVASAALPRLARSAALANVTEFRDTLSRSLVMILLLTLPAATGLAVLGRSMIGIVYQHGRFLAADTDQTALALGWYAAGLVGYCVVKLTGPAFYALGDARTPALVSLGSVAINAATSLTLVRLFGMGHAGLALSTSIVSTCSALVLVGAIRQRIGGIHGRALLRDSVRVAVATAAMGIVCFAVTRGCQMVWSGQMARVANVAFGVPLGAATFYLAARGLGIRELEEARLAVLRRFAV